MKSANLACLLVELAALSVAISACGTSGKDIGTEGGACYPNRTCNDGLECLSNLCVNSLSGHDVWEVSDISVRDDSVVDVTQIDTIEVHEDSVVDVTQTDIIEVHQDSVAEVIDISNDDLVVDVTSDVVERDILSDTRDIVVDEICVADCEGRECGDNGCGGSCGSCGAGMCDNLIWTPAKICEDGACVYEEIENCDDDNPCTDDTCHAVNGCLHDKVLDGTTCIQGSCEGLLWNEPVTCLDGECTFGGRSLQCIDGNDCTDDECSPEFGCVFLPNSLSCDDYDPCTTGDVCQNSDCVGSGTLNCDDNNYCTSNSCIAGQGCSSVPTNEALPCGTGSCSGLSWTRQATCSNGFCTPGATVSCDDGITCTTDSCGSLTGCSNLLQANKCLINEECYGNLQTKIDDKCSQCLSALNPTHWSARSCDDNKPCTTDTCDSGLGCSNAIIADDCLITGTCYQDGDPNPEVLCQVCNPSNKMTDWSIADDGTTCGLGACGGTTWTMPPSCSGGECIAQGNLACVDGLSCTLDGCDPTEGCSNELITNNCLIDGVCRSSSETNTSNPCEACRPGIHFNEWAPVDNGIECGSGYCDDLSFVPAVCMAGQCSDGFPLSCDDGLSCTEDSCGVPTECASILSSGYCLIEQTCFEQMQSNPTNSCQLCASASNTVAWTSVADGDSCFDGSCDGSIWTTATSCLGGQCIGGGSEVSCADDIPCTIDLCDAVSGCSHTTAPNGTACSDVATCQTGRCLCGGMIGLSGPPGTTHDYVAGLSPWAVAIGDLNGDQIPDVAIANRASNNVSVFMNQGNGKFANKVDIIAGNGPRSVAIGDFNRDGWGDLVVANREGDSISVLLNNGNGTFTANGDYYVYRSGPTSIVVKDFDLRQGPDIVVANSGGGKMGVLLNKGDGTFASQVNYPAGEEQTAMATGNFNGGYPDIVIANGSYNTVSVLLNIGYGVFPTKVAYATGTNPASVATGDLNGDGKDDIVVGNADLETISVLTNDGSGAFTNRTDYTVLGRPVAVAVSDLDVDGWADLLALSGSGSVSILRNNGDGSFAAIADYGIGFSPRNIAVGDLDLDGSPDLAVVTEDGFTTMENLGNGDFADREDYQVLTWPTSIAVDDFNRDGRLDLVVAGDEVTVLPGNRDGSFGPTKKYAAGMRIFSVATGDLNGDGAPDLAGTNNDGTPSVSLMMNQGDGTFATAVDYPTGAGPSSVAIADYNGDGKLDVVTANSIDNTVSVFRNLGGGVLAAKVDLAVELTPSFVAFGYLDNDMWPDIVVANRVEGTLSILLNLRNGTFATRVDYQVGGSPAEVAIGDLNGDGYPDLAVANMTSGTVTILFNDGYGTFTSQIEYGAGNPSMGIAIGDVNGDGEPDLVVTNFNVGRVGVLLGNGDGTFSPVFTYSVGGHPYRLAIVELNADGRSDVIVANQASHTVSVLKNVCLSAPTCDVGNACETGTWDAMSQECVFTNIEDGTACGLFGLGGVCASGICVY